MDDYITTDQAATELGVSSRRVRALIKDGRLKAKTVGEGNRATHLIVRPDLDAVRVRKAGRPPKAKPAAKAKRKKKGGAK